MWSLPISTWRTMFSRTTIASSIRMPMASDRPSSDMVLSVKPKAQTAMNDGEHRDRQREAGDHRRAPRVEEQEDDEHGEQRALDQRLLDVAHRVARPARRRRARSRASRPAAASAGARRPRALTASRDRRGAVALGLHDVDADRLLAVEQRERARLGGAVAARRPPAPRRIELAVALRHHELREVLGRLEPALEADRALARARR